ncbi:MAG: 5-oxoprolinase subunit PxpB [Bacteroidota bacterium]
MEEFNNSDYKCFPLGDAAVVIQFGDIIDPVVNLKIKAICEWLDEYTFEGFIEYVPAYTTIIIYYQPWIVDYQELEGMIDEMLEGIAEEAIQVTRNLVEIPVFYGGDYGPDLEFVAAHNSIATEKVIELHTTAEYLVYMIGFAPGFAYMGGMSEQIAAPRMESPRAVISAGSVGIAGMQTGIYPIETPGGWRLIGRTPLVLFNAHRSSPSLLKAGDVVKFSSITELEYIKMKGGDDGY